MGEMLANLNFIIGVLFWLFLCATMMAIVLMLRKLAREMAEVKKALAGLEERIALLAPRAKATTAE